MIKTKDQQFFEKFPVTFPNSDRKYTYRDANNIHFSGDQDQFDTYLKFDHHKKTHGKAMTFLKKKNKEWLAHQKVRDEHYRQTKLDYANKYKISDYLRFKRKRNKTLQYISNKKYMKFKRYGRKKRFKRKYKKSRYNKYRGKRWNKKRSFRRLSQSQGDQKYIGSQHKIWISQSQVTDGINSPFIPSATNQYANFAINIQNEITKITLPTTTMFNTSITSGNDGNRLSSKIYIKRLKWAVRFAPTPGGVAHTNNPPVAGGYTWDLFQRRTITMMIAYPKKNKTTFNNQELLPFYAATVPQPFQFTDSGSIQGVQFNRDLQGFPNPRFFHIKKLKQYHLREDNNVHLDLKGTLNINQVFDYDSITEGVNNNKFPLIFFTINTPHLTTGTDINFQYSHTATTLTRMTYHDI